jgi:hypothetical protein
MTSLTAPFARFAFCAALVVGGNALTIESAAGFAATPYGCGMSCLSQLNGFCPTCGGGNNLYNVYGNTPWGTPQPYYWQTGPVNYSNFYSPAPWSYAPPQQAYAMAYSPGVQGGYFPGGGGFFGAKPNIYVTGTPGTAVTVKLHFKEKGDNWLAAIPAHGEEGWHGTIAENDRVTVDGVTYGYLYSDYRVYGRAFQDTAGFCASKPVILTRIANEMNRAAFSPREIAHFLDYWAVKFPQSESYCVYPQDERVLEQVAALDVTPKAAVTRRVLFLVQVKEGLNKTGAKFSKAPTQEWTPQALRKPASANAITVREWGVGFMAAKKN